MLRLLSLIQVFAIIALVAMVALLLVGVAPTFVGAETFTVLSGSMEPAMPVGSLAVVQPVPNAAFKVGDIITYRTPAQPDVLVTHRVVSTERQPDGSYQFQTKGDANAVADLVQVSPDAVLGRVLYSVPFAGYLGDFAKRPQGLALFIGLPGLLLALDFIRERVRPRPRRREVLAEATALADAAATPHPDAAQIGELLHLGRQAAEAGHRRLAGQAAEQVIQMDPRNEDAWILKADCADSSQERLSALKTGALVNPAGTRLPALVREAESQSSSSPARSSAQALG